MEKIKILFIRRPKLTVRQKSSIKKLQRECFADVSLKAKREDFVAKSFAKILAYKGSRLVGSLGLFKRNIRFAGKKIILGGIGGVCVTKKFRRQGIATNMAKKGLWALHREQCDIACLNANLKKKAHKVYGKLGFTLMKRKISFENIKDKIRYDTGTMFLPIHSKQKYNFVMKNKKTFHYGKGYW